MSSLLSISLEWKHLSAMIPVFRFGDSLSYALTALSGPAVLRCRFINYLASEPHLCRLWSHFQTRHAAISRYVLSQTGHF